MGRKHLIWIVVLLLAAFTLPADAADVKKLKKEARKAVEAGDFESAIGVVQEIATLGGEKARDALYEIGKKYGVSKELYEAVITELSGMDGALPWIVEKFEKSKGADQIFIADILAANTGEDLAVTTLASALEEKNTILQGVAVEGLMKSKNGLAVGPLIDLLEKLSKKKKKDILYYQVRDALFELTYEDFDLIEDWRNWWAPREGSFDPKKDLNPEGPTGVKRKKRGDDADFFGVPVTSKHVVFIIDNSGSMKYVMKDDIPGLARADGSDSGQGSGGGRMTPEDQKLAKFWTRMEMAKRELRKCVRALKTDTHFNIVVFNTDTMTFKKKSIVASPGGKKKALELVESLNFKDHGNTHTMKALVDAFRCDKKTNTIFFLSDGLPSKDGKVEDPTSPILDKVFQMNRFRKIKINTFGYYPYTFSDGQLNPRLDAANKFLKKLAESTGGKYTDMKVDPALKPE